MERLKECMKIRDHRRKTANLVIRDALGMSI
jgi:hypothetical protein